MESPYYTVDFAELSDGSWRVIEAGDGSVSGLSEGQNYGQYFRALYQCLKNMEESLVKEEDTESDKEER